MIISEIDEILQRNEEHEFFERFGKDIDATLDFVRNKALTDISDLYEENDEDKQFAKHILNYLNQHPDYDTNMSKDIKVLIRLYEKEED